MKHSWKQSLAYLHAAIVVVGVSVVELVVGPEEKIHREIVITYSKITY